MRLDLTDFRSTVERLCLGPGLSAGSESPSSLLLEDNGAGLLEETDTEPRRGDSAVAESPSSRLAGDTDTLRRDSRELGSDWRGEGLGPEVPSSRLAGDTDVRLGLERGWAARRVGPESLTGGLR